jgi:putative Holliday junction resolvase
MPNVSNRSETSQPALADLLPETGRLMGLDLGTKTIGVAISDTRQTVATPLETVRRVKFGPDSDRLLTLATEHQVTGIVLGLPLNMDGSEGPRVQSTRAFARNLAARCDLPIGFWDERMSTMAVERTMLEADLSRARRAQIVDKLAASYILQGALDGMRSR